MTTVPAWLFPESCPVWRVEVDPRLAERLRREFGSVERAGRVEEDGQSEFGEPPEGARVLRVEEDAPVVVLVWGTWPHPDRKYLTAWFHRALLEAEPVPSADSTDTSLGALAWFFREHRLAPFDGDEPEGSA